MSTNKNQRNESSEAVKKATKGMSAADIDAATVIAEATNALGDTATPEDKMVYIAERLAGMKATLDSWKTEADTKAKEIDKKYNKSIDDMSSAMKAMMARVDSTEARIKEQKEDAEKSANVGVAAICTLGAIAAIGTGIYMFRAADGE